jgi:hypothetical protein
MIRAGVFIGVDRTGALQQLNDAAAGARRIYDWAIGQGMLKGTHAHLITDEGGGKVTPDQVYDAIKTLIDGAGIDQLVLYFAGHGVNINRCEHWLLSDAPTRTSAAINVTGSVELARYCGIGHVVIMSDACRVAPEGIQAQNVRGQDVFPNDGAADKAKPVDQFFACVLGKTAAEIKDPQVAASNYSALYTDALLDALLGQREDIFELSGEPADTARYIKPVKLEEYLEKEIPQRVLKLKLEKKVNQNPDAILTAHSNWISRIDPTRLPPARPPSRGPSAPAGAAPGAPPKPVDNLRVVTRKLVTSAAAPDQSALSREITRAKTLGLPGAERLVDSVEQIAVPFGPDHFETQCGIKIRGNRVVEAYTRWAQVDLLGNQGDLVRVNQLVQPAASVLLKFADGRGALIPAITGFVAALTFDEDELVDVAYEPSANNWRWNLYKDRAGEVRTLRAVAATASQHGRFRLDDANAMNIARNMQYAKGIDPTLSVYAAYAYHDLHAVGLIRDMSNYLRDDIGTTFFDLALLGRQLLDKAIDVKSGVVPFVPLLAQGWALLSANKVRMHPLLQGIETTVLESLWSLFDPSGVEKLRRALASGELQ